MKRGIKVLQSFLKVMLLATTFSITCHFILLSVKLISDTSHDISVGPNGIFHLLESKRDSVRAKIKAIMCAKI